MFLALQKAAERRGRKLHLLLTGWIEGDGSRPAFTDAATQACPDVKVHLLDGQNAEIRTKAWAAADIFTLPVDNIQETFGLAPVEAMAAGLPVVVTDWDGFRDTVEDGVTGFRIPTMMGGNGNSIAMRYQMGADDYNAYLRATSQAIAMDIGAAADAYYRLAEDANLRRQMAEAARLRARRMYIGPPLFRSILRCGTNRRASAPRPRNSRHLSLGASRHRRAPIPLCCLRITLHIGWIPSSALPLCPAPILIFCASARPFLAPWRAVHCCLLSMAFK